MPRSIREHALPYLPVVLLPVLLFSVQLFGGRALYWGTPGLQFIPWRAHAWDLISQGTLPLWNALNGMGAPLAANYQLALFYPPGWIAYLFAAIGGAPWLAWSHTLLVVLHLIFAGWGMARLANSYRLGPLAQTAGALAFSLGGYLAARAGFFSMVWTASWLPWVLLAAGRIAAPGKAREETPRLFPRALTVFLALMLLAGHAQLSWYILLLGAAWVLAGGWEAGGPRYGVKSLLRFGIAAAVAALLSAVQLLPTAQYLLLSQRSTSVDFDTLMSYSFWPWRFITLVAPDFFGNPGHGDYWGYANYWEDAVYIGLLPLLLALGTLRYLGRKPFAEPAQAGSRALVRFLWVVVAVSFVMGLGKNTPVFLFLYEHVPTFDMFNAPSRYLIWAAFALPLLAGIGAENWRAPRGRALYWLRLATAGGFAVTLGAFLGWYFLGDVSPTFIRATALAGVWGLGAGLLTLFIPPAESPRRELWRWLVVAWVAGDLLLAGWALNPSVPASFYAGSPSGLAGRLDGHRLFLSSQDDYDLKYRRFLRFSDFRPIEDVENIREVALPNLNLLEGAESANNFDPMVPERYATWMSALEALPLEERMPLLALMDVGLVEVMDVGEPLGVRFTPVDGAGRYRWYSCWEPALDPGDALEKTLALAQGGTLSDRVVVEAYDFVFEADVEDCTPSDAVYEITVLEERPTLVRLRVDAPEWGWLFLADSDYPGWEATIQPAGEPQPRPTAVYTANYAFRAVSIPAGETILEMRYRPGVFLWGAAMSLFAWLFVLISIIMMWRISKGILVSSSEAP